MVGGRARLHPDQASRLLSKERQQLAARQTPLEYYFPSSINVYLNDRIPEVQSDCHHCFDGSPPFCESLKVGWLVESRPRHR